MVSNEMQFHPVKGFDFDVNRSERAQQVRLLVPLLLKPEGRAWFLQRLDVAYTARETRLAKAYHFCFPLRDVFTRDYYQCRGTSLLERQFIAYYNRLFGLPEDFGVEEVWLTAGDGGIRHPAAGGRAGWYDGFLEKRIADGELRQRARNVRRMLGTEADALLLTEGHVLLVECKYLGGPSTEQYERHQMMGETLARRLGKGFYFGMVVGHERDPQHAQLDVPYVAWAQVEAQLRQV